MAIIESKNDYITGCKNDCFTECKNECYMMQE